MESKREKEECEREQEQHNKVTSQQNQEASKTTTTRKGKSCKGTLYYSSLLKSKSRNPRCVGFTSSLQQVPNYIISESEVEASKEGRSLTDFKYACVGYSVYLDNKDAPPTGDQKPRAELPVCVGLELLVDKRPVDNHTPAHAHNKEEERGLPQSQPQPQPRPQPQPQRPTHPVGEEFFTRFTRNAGLVASGVARNMRKVGNYIKDSVDDILYPYRRRPK